MYYNGYEVKDGNGASVSSGMNVNRWLEIDDFVRKFSNQRRLFTSHEIGYLKNNCEDYPENSLDDNDYNIESKISKRMEELDKLYGWEEDFGRVDGDDGDERDAFERIEEKLDRLEGKLKRTIKTNKT